MAYFALLWCLGVHPSGELYVDRQLDKADVKLKDPMAETQAMREQLAIGLRKLEREIKVLVKLLDESIKRDRQILKELDEMQRNRMKHGSLSGIASSAAPSF
jgi:hypothetical protein